MGLFFIFFFYSRNPANYNILLGGHESGTGEEHAVQNISIHPLFNVIQPSSYDVAVVRFVSAIIVGRFLVYFVFLTLCFVSFSLLLVYFNFIEITYLFFRL